jgi:hypothetical protein
MSLRIAFDLDGVLADFESVYHRIAEDLFGEGPASAAPAEQSAEEAAPGLADRDRPTVALPLSAGQEDEVWQEIEKAENFWMSLEPHEPGVLARIQDLATRHRWEVFFVTHRPPTAGETVQRQSQRWLIAHGFELPSVMVMTGPRGRLARALTLDYLIDDSPQHCANVVSESETKAVLVLRRSEPTAVRGAREMGFEVTPTVAAALDLLERAQEENTQPSLWKKLTDTIRGGR